MNFTKKGTEKIELVAKPDVHVRISPPKSLRLLKGNCRLHLMQEKFDGKNFLPLD